MRVLKIIAWSIAYIPYFALTNEHRMCYMLGMSPEHRGKRDYYKSKNYMTCSDYYYHPGKMQQKRYKPLTTLLREKGLIK